MKDEEEKSAAESWPNEISMTAFRQAWELEGTPVWETVFEMHSENMQIKNINVAISNLENIFDPTEECGRQDSGVRFWWRANYDLFHTGYLGRNG